MISTEFAVNLNDPPLADFLADVANATGVFVQVAVQPDGFIPQHRRMNAKDTGSVNAPFLVRELYRLKLENVPQGTLAAEVFVEQKLSFWLEYVLFLRGGLTPEVIERARKLVDAYDPSTAPDLAVWIAEQIKDGWVAENDIALLVDVHIQKIGSSRYLDVTQRDALFRLYDPELPNIQATIDVLNDTNFPHWAGKRAANLELIGTEAVRKNQPQVGREIAEIPIGKSPGSAMATQLKDILDDVSRNLLPLECRGGFERKELRLLSVLDWPEFKLEWRTITIKVGCANVQFSMPWLRVRIAHLFVFIYYHLPVKVDEAALTIAKNCAIRSALSGAVVGIVVGNPAAAIAAFQSFFVDCLRQDTFDCINPGLFLAKEVGQWQ